MNINVFLADNHPVVRDGLRILLDAHPDITVIGAAVNGHDAVQLVTKLQPDVVVMDAILPGLNGIEATRQIHQICPSIQIIILSIHATIEHVVRVLKAGANGYLIKESIGTEVVDAIQAVNVGHRYLSQKISDMMIDNYVRQLNVLETTSSLVYLSPHEQEAPQFVVGSQ